MPLRLLLTPPLAGPENMALDEALMARARRTGERVLRVYGWAVPTLSFGRNQTARALYDAARCAARGIAVVRRPTGGRAILHHREVTYSVTAPVRDDEPLRESYTRINRLLVAGLRALGVAVRVAEPAGRARVPDGAPCFEAPAAGELVLDDPAAGGKLVGSAQWRDAGALLQHGSILLDDDQSVVPELATRPLPPVPPPATLRAALGRAPSLPEVADALFAAARTVEDRDAGVLEIDEALAADAAAARARYADPAWTWRR